MYKDVSIGQLCEPPMLTVSVGEVENGHLNILKGISYPVCKKLFFG